MSDTVLQTQIRNAGRYLKSENSHDVLAPALHATVKQPLSVDKRYVTPLGSDAFGSFVEYELPYGYISDCYIVATLGALTSGNYTTYPGLSLIDEVELRSGSNVLQQFRYSPVAHECLSRMPDEMVNELKVVSGGTSFASGDCVIPLPLFWSRFANPGEDYQVPLNTHLASTKLRLRIKYRSAADVSDAGATTGSPTISTRLYCITHDTVPSLRAQHLDSKDAYVYKANDFQTLPQSSAVATATSTTLDASSLNGSLASLAIFHKLVSDIDTAHDYFLDQGDMDEIKLRIDGRDYWLSEFNESIRFDKLLLSGHPGQTATYGDPVTIPFQTSHDPNDWSGSLEMDSINKLEIVLKHSGGANCYVDTVARVHAFFTVDHGSFMRHN